MGCSKRASVDRNTSTNPTTKAVAAAAKKAEASEAVARKAYRRHRRRENGKTCLLTRKGRLRHKSKTYEITRNLSPKSGRKKMMPKSPPISSPKTKIMTTTRRTKKEKTSSRRLPSTPLSIPNRLHK